MRILREMREEDIGEQGGNAPVHYEVRRAARAVVFDTEGNVAVLHVTKEDYWKIPGGGIEEGEDVKRALEREVEEEAGVDVEIGGEVGVITEDKRMQKEFQTSYCYIAYVVGKKRGAGFTQQEMEEGFELHWMPYAKALEMFHNSRPKTYRSKFMQLRDGIFLEAAGKIRSGI